MNTLTLIADLLILQGRNQWALAVAIADLNKWVAQRGSIEVAKNVEDTLGQLNDTLLPLSRGIALLIEAAEQEMAATAQTTAPRGDAAAQHR